MSKEFTQEMGHEEDLEEVEPLPEDVKNLMTPIGFSALQAELEFLRRKERPKIVEIVSWAAGNGDRSENGDYIYNKKRLREIDRRIRYLTKRLDNPEVIDPKKQQGLEQIFFGASVTYAREDGSQYTIKLVGVDEANMEEGKINWLSPIAKALMKARVGDIVEARLDTGRDILEIISISYSS